MKISKQHIVQLINKITDGLLCLSLILVLFWPITAMAEETEQKTVRVGFFPCPFNIKDENGHMSGYAYDYQQDLAAYTGWKYEYVEASWPELLQMLKDGEIDLLSDVSITPEREEEMLFSSYPMGTESYYLYVSNRNSDIDETDYSTLEGKRIGVNAGSIQADLFHEWAKMNGIAMNTIIPCYGDDVIVDMLANGELDAAVAVDSYGFDNTIPMARIGGSDFYFAINSARPDIKAELDNAMHLLLSKNRYYNEGLYQKYLNNNASKSIPSDELKWLQEHGTIRIGYLDNYLAYCDRDYTSGELTGALQEFLSIAESCLYNATLEFEAVAFSNAADMRAALQEGEVDCIFPAYFDRYYAEQSQMYVTNSVADTGMIALVNSVGFKENAENVVVIPNSSIEAELYVENNYPLWIIVDAVSEQECIDMVRKGEADCTVFSANRVDYIIPTNRYDGLMCITLSCNTSISFAVRRDNVHLLHILNQVIDAVPDSAIHGALTYYATAPKSITFADFVKEHMTAVFGLIGIIILVLGLMICRMYVNGKKLTAALEEAKKEKEYSNKLNLYNRELEAEANSDALTQIGNRHFFFAKMGELLETNEKFVICYCDLDNLKYINDKYGHTEGDCYIRHFVDVVNSHIRAGDIFARIGGDEFCIMLRRCKYETALKKIQQMQMLFNSDHTKEYPKSFSCGIIEVPEDHGAIEVMEILKQADEMMYEQKKEHKKIFQH